MAAGCCVIADVKATIGKAPIQAVAYRLSGSIILLDLNVP